jgi:hypothetical protein
MKTDDLIKALAADTALPARPLARTWLITGAAAALLAAVVFFATIGPRPDIADAAQTVRFLLKPMLTLILAATAFAALSTLSRPGARPNSVLLAAAPALLALAVIAELAVLPAEAWRVNLVGTNALVCLTYIPLIGIGPLAAFLLALRHGAPTRPTLAGAVAGLLAGGVAATLYALHCPDDSPLFVATWYTLAIAGLAVIGALAAPRIARW